MFGVVYFSLNLLYVHSYLAVVLKASQSFGLHTVDATEDLRKQHHKKKMTYLSVEPGLVQTLCVLTYLNLTVSISWVLRALHFIDDQN